MPYCLGCGSMIDEYDSGYYARNMFCIPCYNRKSIENTKVPCARCGVQVRQDEAKRRSDGVYCIHCYFELERLEKIAKTVTCPICKKPIESWQKSMKSPSGAVLHVECAEKTQWKGVAARCIRCGKQTGVYKVTADGLVVCYACATKKSEATADQPLLSRMVDKIGSMIG